MLLSSAALPFSPASGLYTRTLNLKRRRLCHSDSTTVALAAACAAAVHVEAAVITADGDVHNYGGDMQ